MKVFDFTDGKKGKLLGDIKKQNSSGGWFVVKNNKKYCVRLNNESPWEGVKFRWAKHATYYDPKNGNEMGEVQILPEHFGVDAICFCYGGFKEMGNDTVWEWTVLGTNEWNKNACKKGILKATIHHCSDIESQRIKESQDKYLSA